MTIPYFSVILPTYNRARMAAAAILSVLGQSERDFELFVVDDGSTDDTRRVLSLLPKDTRIKMILSERNKGMNPSRNQAISEAKGRFITFLDSDDLFLPERLAGFRRAIEERPERGFWFSNAYVRRFGVILDRVFDPAQEIPEGKVPGHYAIGSRFLPYLTTNVAIKREAFDRWGLFRTDMKTLDTELFARFLGEGLEVGVLREALAVRHLHDRQLTDQHLDNFKESLQALKTANPPGESLEGLRKEVAADVAGYLLKDLRPLDARELLRKELGGAAKEHPLYLRTFLPVPVLRALKSLRRVCLQTRYSALFAPSEYKRAERLIRPYLDQAARL